MIRPVDDYFDDLTSQFLEPKTVATHDDDDDDVVVVFSSKSAPAVVNLLDSDEEEIKTEGRKGWDALAYQTRLYWRTSRQSYQL